MKTTLAIMASAFFCGYFLTGFTDRSVVSTTEGKLVENNAPKLSIEVPGANGKFNWNTMVRYKINVVDKEDGASEFNEISANEVLLEVVYYADSVKAKKYLSDKSKLSTEHPGLSLIKKSDCFNCHASKTKLIGPSFDLIAHRYPGNTQVDMLSKKVLNGSSGVWGDISMPPHPGLKAEEAAQMVRWIIANNANPNLFYLPGVSGTFKTIEKPTANPGKSVYVLTATYLDNGIEGKPETRKLGRHSVLLKSGN
ncbi:MAG: hypothetical protein JNL51_00830 [Chitinophagaceae bacterium]|nr:hypothetical protein [Chitinophagaceae bacterium]